MNTGSVLAEYTITLSKAVTEPVSVDWYTSDGTAKANIDYQANKGTVVFAPGETVKVVQVLVYGRAVGTEDRSFYVEMLPPTNAILGKTIGECIIHVDTTGSQPVTQIIIPAGPKGDNGESAYQTWLSLPGNAGKTEQEFIDSLKPSAQEIAQEIVPLLDIGDTSFTSEGTSTLSTPDTLTVKRLGRRVAYAEAAKIATVTLADGDNVVGQNDMTGDTINFSSANLYPRIMRSGNVISPRWNIQTDGKLLIKNAIAGDRLFVCQYDFTSSTRANSNLRELWKRALADVGLNLVDGSFEEGATATTNKDAVWHMAGSQCYIWYGALSKTVSANSTPVSTGGISGTTWQPVGSITLGSADGYTHIGGLKEHYSQPLSVIIVDNAPYNGSLQAAYDSVSGNAVFVMGKQNVYRAPVTTFSAPNTKPNIMFVGQGKPVYDWVNKKLITGSGTIIQGGIYNKAKGFGMMNLGVDVSDSVRTGVFGGTYSDGIVCYDFGTDAGLFFDNISVVESVVDLGIPSSFTHCFLMEKGSGVHHGDLELINGYHGWTIKCSDLSSGGIVTMHGQQGSSGIIKSDAGTNAIRNIKAPVFNIGHYNAVRSAGFVMEAGGGFNVGDVYVPSITAINTFWVFTPAVATTDFITDTVIANCVGYNISDERGAGAAIRLSNKCVGVSILHHYVNGQSGIGVLAESASSSIGTGIVKGCSSHGYKFTASTDHGNLLATNNGGYGVFNSGTAYFNTQLITCLANTSGGINVINTLTVAFLNSWANDSDGSFRATRNGSTVRISGGLRNGFGGGNSWQAVAAFTECKPALNEYLSVVAVNTSSGSPVPAVGKIDANGVLSVYGVPSSGHLLFISGSYTTQSNQ